MRCPILAMTFTLLVAASRPASAQRVMLDSIATADTSLHHEVRTRDGSRFVGRVVSVSPDSIGMVLRSGPVTLARGQVREVRQFGAASLHNGEYWAENPNPTRLLFSATAYSLRRGSGYYWNSWILLHGFAVGVTDRLTLGGGFSLVPGIGIENNFFFVTHKLTLTGGTGPQVAVGALAGFFPGIGSNGDGGSLGILYGVSSLGTRENNLSLGLGWGYVESNIADRPVIMVGGQARVSRRLALISENWFVPGDGYNGVLSYGFRFLGDKLSVDLAFINSLENAIFPGIPWLGFAVKF